MWGSWVRVPAGAQIRYAEIRGEDMPQGALVPNATISDKRLGNGKRFWVANRRKY